MATSRTDIIAGSFIADTYPLFGCDKKIKDAGTIRHIGIGPAREADPGVISTVDAVDEGERPEGGSR